LARRLTAAERREYAEQTVSLSSRGVSIRRISERLGIARGTVASLLREALAELDPGVDAARAEAIRHYREVVGVCWTKINASGKELAGGGFVPMMSPHGMAGLLNTALSAQEKIDKLRGVQPPQHHILEHQMSVSDLAKRVADTPPERRLQLVDEGL
jgi:hypothetical protein